MPAVHDTQAQAFVLIEPADDYLDALAVAAEAEELVDVEVRPDTCDIHPNTTLDGDTCPVCLIDGRVFPETRRRGRP
jgi:hypothetical protein